MSRKFSFILLQGHCKLIDKIVLQNEKSTVWCTLDQNPYPLIPGKFGHQLLIQFKMVNHWTAIENVKSLVLLLISHLLQLVFYALPSKQTEII